MSDLKLNNPTSTNSKFKRHLLGALMILSLISYSIYTHISCFNETAIEIPPNPYANIKPLRPSDSKKAHFIYTDPEFRNKSLETYQGILQIPTEVYDFTQRPEIDISGWEPFLKLHEYLEETFPLVFKHLKVEKINKLGLIVTYQGSDSSLPPLLLTAHQDVVPVDTDTLKSWKYPPYSAHFDGQFVWARGSADTKNLLSGIFETFEELLKDGVKPKRTIIFAGGYDEEAIGRYDGAVSLSSFLEERYGHKSFYGLVDEGGSVSKFGDSWIATPSIGEKGYLDIYIELFVPGGHSSIPPDHTSIGIVGELTTLIESNPYPSVLTLDNPILDLLRTVGETSNELDDSIRYDYIHAKFDEGALKRTLERLTKEKGTKYLVRTSQAIDIIQAGVKINALPEVLTLGINHRISLELTADEIIHNVVGHVEKIAKKHNLGLTWNNSEVILDTTDEGHFNVYSVQALDPSPLSTTNDKTWDVFASSIKHTYDDIVFKSSNDTISVAPSLVGGYTDASRYWPLTDHVYRFIAATGAGYDIHAINERFEFDSHLQTIAFLYDYILNVNEYDS